MSDRTARNRDRTRILYVSVVGLVAALVIFLGVFSSSRSTAKREPAAKHNPSLGRPDGPTRPTGSVTPLMNAELNGRDPGDGQLTAEDIHNTARPRGEDEGALSEAAPMASRTASRRRETGIDAPFKDPALEAYRQRMAVSTDARPPAGPTAAPPPAPPAATATSESGTLAKSSLIYVRAKANSGASTVEGAQTLPANAPAQPTLQDRKVWSGLPAGTRLVARLEAAVSTAVKTAERN